MLAPEVFVVCVVVLVVAVDGELCAQSPERAQVNIAMIKKGIFMRASFHDPGQSEDQRLACMELVAVARNQRLLQLGIDAQQFLI